MLFIKYCLDYIPMKFNLYTQENILYMNVIRIDKL